jgi:hypothetical protein
VSVEVVRGRERRPNRIERIERVEQGLDKRLALALADPVTKGTGGFRPRLRVGHPRPQILDRLACSRPLASFILKACIECCPGDGSVRRDTEFEEGPDRVLEP